MESTRAGQPKLGNMEGDGAQHNGSRREPAAPVERTSAPAAKLGRGSHQGGSRSSRASGAVEAIGAR